MSRINWRQLAKTGEFVTVQYRRERAARTVVVVDCRPCTRVTPWAGYPTGGALAAYAAERIHDALREEGVVTSLTAVGLEEELPHLTGPDGLPWVDPGSTDGSATALFRGINRAANGATRELSLRPPPSAVDARAAARADGGLGRDSQAGRTNGAHGRQRDANRQGQPGVGDSREPGRPASPQTEREISERTRRLLSRLPSNAQVVLCSPALDNWPVEFGRELRLRGYSCTLVSPDAAAGRSHGQRLGAVHRRLRLRALERSGVTVTDWPIDRPVEYALQYTIPQL